MSVIAAFPKRPARPRIDTRALKLAQAEHPTLSGRELLASVQRWTRAWRARK